MAYTDDAVMAKLSALNETKDGIITVAQWIMFHRFVRALIRPHSRIVRRALPDITGGYRMASAGDDAAIPPSSRGLCYVPPTLLDCELTGGHLPPPAP